MPVVVLRKEIVSIGDVVVERYVGDSAVSIRVQGGRATFTLREVRELCEELMRLVDGIIDERIRKFEEEVKVFLNEDVAVNAVNAEIKTLAEFLLDAGLEAELKVD